MTVYRYAAESRVALVEEKFKTTWSGKDAEGKAVSQRQSEGWWVTTQGPSPISIRCGDTKPPHKFDDKVTIAIEVHSKDG